METAKIFKNGRSQAVRLPKDCRMAGNEVYVKKYGEMLMLIPKKSPWAPLIQSLDEFTDDFMESGRMQPPIQERKAKL